MAFLVLGTTVGALPDEFEEDGSRVTFTVAESECFEELDGVIDEDDEVIDGDDEEVAEDG